MEELLQYEPKAIGMVIDVGLRSHLSQTKDLLISLIDTLSLETEDKVYVYNPDNINLPRRLSESVAAVANYREDGKFSLDVAMKQSVTALSQVQEDSSKILIFVTDRYYPSQAWKLEEGFRLDKRYSLNCSFFLLYIGEEDWFEAETFGGYSNVKIYTVNDDNFERLRKTILCSKE